MKIRIVTEREIREEDYDLWVHALQCNGLPVDGEILRKTGEHRVIHVGLGTKVVTTYTIVKEES